MSETTRFIFFSLATVLTIVVSYAGRTHGIFKEEWARPIHHFVLVYTWSLAYLLGTWHLPIRVESVWVPVLIGVTLALPAVLMKFVATKAGLPGKQVGVAVVAAGIANTGFTLGAYLVYLLFEQGDKAMGYGATWGALNTFGLVLVIYPLVRRYGELDDPSLSTARLVVRSFTTLPALPMYASIAGWTLAASGVRPPAFIRQWHVIDAVTYVVCIGSYFGIGLRIRLGETLRYGRGHALVAAFAFLVSPLVMGGAILLTHLTGRPIDALGAKVLFVESFMPIGVSTVLVANIFHLDARMAGNIWLWNTLGFLLVVLPLIVWAV